VPLDERVERRQVVVATVQRRQLAGQVGAQRRRGHRRIGAERGQQRRRIGRRR
jgi:hypothetical protein